MDKNRLATVGLGLSLLLAGCGQTSTGSTGTDQLKLSLSQQQVQPLHNLTATVLNPKPGATYTFQYRTYAFKNEDNGVANFYETTQSSTTQQVPAVIYREADLPYNEGRVTVVEKLDGKERTAFVKYQITKLTSPRSPGTATVALLKAQRIMLLNAMARMRELTLTSSVTSPNYVNLLIHDAMAKKVSTMEYQLGAFQATLEQAMRTGSAYVYYGGTNTVTIDASTLAALDQETLAYIQLVTENAVKTQGLQAQATSLLDMIDDPGLLAREVAEGIREKAAESSSSVVLGAGIAAFVLGGSAAVPVAIVGALAFAVPTFVGGTISAMLDSAAAQATKGKASLKDLFPTGEFVFKQYADLASGHVKSAAINSVFNGKVGEFIDVAMSAQDSFSSYVGGAVMSDYQNGYLPEAGLSFTPPPPTLMNVPPLPSSGSDSPPPGKCYNPGWPMCGVK